GGPVGLQGGGMLFKQDENSAVQYAKSVSGQPYVFGGLDCSELVRQMVERYTDKKGPQLTSVASHPMVTGNEADWLQSMGLVIGDGPPGTLRVGWETYSDGGGHTAMTLPDGTNVESSGSGGVQYGGKARGA